jgi:predicted alpha/beta-fold hydrolase
VENYYQRYSAVNRLEKIVKTKLIEANEGELILKAAARMRKRNRSNDDLA